LNATNTNDKKITLKQFIEDNHKLLTIEGVMFAVVGFFSRENDLLSKSISSAFFWLSLIVARAL